MQNEEYSNQDFLNLFYGLKKYDRSHLKLKSGLEWKKIYPNLICLLQSIGCCLHHFSLENLTFLDTYYQVNNIKMSSPNNEFSPKYPSFYVEKSDFFSPFVNNILQEEMDFARKELEKYGWKEGQGLGKKEDGISTALKPKLKFDNSGVGHNPGDDFSNNWWEDLYNRAAENIDVQKKDGEVKLGLKSGQNVEITIDSCAVSALKKNNGLEYGSFVKTSKLTQAGVEHYQVEGSKVKESSKNKIKVLSDEELFRACGGRTMNQASRFGIYMSGKLSRLERQEKLLLKKMKNVSLSDAPILEKKVKKLKKSKGIQDDITSTEIIPFSPYKKKKKKERSVSFSEVVTEYYPPPEDTSSESSHRDENNEPQSPESVSSNTQDEGIEIDISIVDKPKKPVATFDDLSKAERKKLKKRRENRATARFLSEIGISEGGQESSTSHEESSCQTPENKTLQIEIKFSYDGDTITSKCKKRKLTFDDIEDITSHSQKSSQKHDKKSKDHKKDDNSYVKTEKKKDKHRGKSWIKKPKAENQLNQIVQSLDTCKISDAE